MRLHSGFLFAWAFLTACSGSTPEDSSTAHDFDAVSRWLSESGSGVSSAAAPTPASESAPVEELIGGLEARLDRQPEDVKGWKLLARSYAFVGRLGDAEAAAERAVALGEDADQMAILIARAHDGR